MAVLCAAGCLCAGSAAWGQWRMSLDWVRPQHGEGVRALVSLLPPRGEWGDGVTIADFAVRERGVERPITSFATAPPIHVPVAWGMAVDAGDHRDLAAAALRHCFEYAPLIPAKGCVTSMGISVPRVVQDPTVSRATLISSTSLLQSSPQPRPDISLHDRNGGIIPLMQPLEGRKVVILKFEVEHPDRQRMSSRFSVIGGLRGVQAGVGPRIFLPLVIVRQET